MNHVIPAAALLSATALLGACVVVDSQGHIVREEKQFTVEGTPEVHLTTHDGAIAIRTASDTRTVLVEIEKRGATPEAVGGLRVDAKQEGNRVDVEVRKPSHDVVLFGIGHITPTASLVVTMPRDGRVFANTGDGSIRVDGLRGRIDLHTNDGSVRGREIAGDVAISTGDGSVTLDDTQGNLDVETADGSVRVSGRLTGVRLHTGDGSVTVQADPGSAMGSDWSISTADGGVTVYIPSDFNAEVDAQTSDGSVRSELRGLREEDGERNRRALKGRLGSGGRTLKIRTADGSIRLRSG